MSIHPGTPDTPLPPHQRTAVQQGTAPVRTKPRNRKSSTWAKTLILFILIFMVIFLGGDIRQMLAASTTPPPKPLANAGPLIQAPLNSDEINQLHHLSEYFNDLTLANMYLSHMTLDQKLGQLFMVQYWGDSYSSDLETMIHDQYAGGVIMYGAQMNTFNQTKDDIARMQQKAWMPLDLNR